MEEAVAMADAPVMGIHQFGASLIAAGKRGTKRWRSSDESRAASGRPFVTYVGLAWLHGDRRYEELRCANWKPRSRTSRESEAEPAVYEQALKALKEKGGARDRAASLAGAETLNPGAVPLSKVLMDTLLQDLRYAARTLVKNPGFAALTILLPRARHRRQQHDLQRRRHGGDPAAAVSRPRHAGRAVIDAPGQRHRPRQRVVSRPAGLEAAHPRVRRDRGRGRPQPDAARTATSRSGSTARPITANMFPMLGIQPILGRQIRPEEDTPGGPRVVRCSSHGVWQRALRQRIRRSSAARLRSTALPHTVIGVMPPKFQFPERRSCGLPQAPIEHTSPRAGRNLEVIARAQTGRYARRWRAATSRRVGDQLAGRGARRSGLERGRGQRCATKWCPPTSGSIVMTMMGRRDAGAADRLRQRREPAAGARDGPAAGDRRSARRSAPAAAGSCGSCSPRACSSRWPARRLGVAIAYVGLQWLTASIPPQSQAPYYIDWSMNPRIVVYTGPDRAGRPASSSASRRRCRRRERTCRSR